MWFSLFCFDVGAQAGGLFCFKKKYSTFIAFSFREIFVPPSNQSSFSARLLVFLCKFLMTGSCNKQGKAKVGPARMAQNTHRAELIFVLKNEFWYSFCVKC